MAAARSAPPPSGAAQTLWAHHDADGYFMSTLMEEPDQDSGAPGYNAIIFVLGPIDGGAPLEANWVLPLAPALDAPVALDTSKPVHFTLFLSAFAAGPFTGTLPGGQGQATGTIAVSLTAGGTVVASGAEQDASVKEGTPSKFEWDVMPTAASLSGALEWHVDFSGYGTGIAMGQGEAVGRSFLIIPAVGGFAAPAAQTVYRTLAGTSVDNTTSFAAPTTQALQFNWTSALRNATVTLSAVRQAGNLTVAILDAANRTLVSHAFGASANSTSDVRNAAPGAWRILVNATAFQGTLRIQISAPGAVGGGGSDGGPGTGSSATGTGGSGTTGPGGTGGSGGGSQGGSSSPKGTPAPGLLWGVAAVAAALLAARRRNA